MILVLIPGLRFCILAKVHIHTSRPQNGLTQMPKRSRVFTGNTPQCAVCNRRAPADMPHLNRTSLLFCVVCVCGFQDSYDIPRQLDTLLTVCTRLYPRRLPATTQADTSMQSPASLRVLVKFVSILKTNNLEQRACVRHSQFTLLWFLAP